MKIPTIHINGTDGDELRDLNLAAYAMILNALESAARAAPNARDFYVQGLDAFTLARDEHEHAVAELRKASEHFRAIYEGIQEQIDEREMRRAEDKLRAEGRIR